MNGLCAASQAKQQNKLLLLDTDFSRSKIPETVSLFPSRVRTVDREVTAEIMSRERSGVSRFSF